MTMTNLHFRLRDYQQNVLHQLESITDDRVCVSLSTGAGKTILFSQIVNQSEKRILILVHRDELVSQTAKNISREYNLITAKSKYKGAPVAIAMIQTFRNRNIDVNSFDLLIVDECHRGEFMSILDSYKGKVIGFTATPNYEKTEYFYKCLKCGTDHKDSIKCCGVNVKKYRRTVPLSRYYHNLLEGVCISELIEQGYLVPEEHHVFQTDETIEVYDHKTGELTEESANAIYGSEEGIRNSIEAFNKLCRGKKTIIFNPNTLVNRLLYEAMIKEDINCKMFDSNNASDNRKELIEWFENTADAVLLNVHVFTTGFDCTDVECIFLNKKTRSVNLYIQMVGRGGRITDKIFKPKFTVVDIGNNLELFGKWSEKRDWSEYFYNEKVSPVGAPKPLKTRECHQCEAILASNSLKCEYCGAERVYNGKSNGSFSVAGKKIMPSAEKIVQYCEQNNLDCNFARKLTIKYVVELFENTSKKTFEKNKNNGRLAYATQKHLIPYYFAISQSKLPGNRLRRLDTFTGQTINELEKYYNDRSSIATANF